MFDEEGRKINLDTPRARNLEPLSIEDMRAYIVWLQGEIARVEQAIDARDDKRAAAEALFK